MQRSLSRVTGCSGVTHDRSSVGSEYQNLEKAAEEFE